MNFKDRIILFLKQKGRVTSGQIALEFKVSRQYAHKILTKMAGEHLIIKRGKTRSSVYELPYFSGETEWKFKKRIKNKNLAEHIVLEEIEQKTGFRELLKENLQSIFEYAFSEMLNNAIEHSQSENIQLEAEKTDKLLMFKVNDSGIGVFRNIMKKRGLNNELEAIQDLLKGKTTTQPEAHSGEGIFFTSKTADLFSLESFSYKLTIDNEIEDIFVEKRKRPKRGTEVFFKISISSSKHLNDVFRQYQTDSEEYAFDKTEVKIKLYTLGTVHISRSQARRVLSGLEKFKTVILDFDKVSTVGQAFADEIFRVFKNQHPEIRIIPVNTNEVIEFMVGRVGN